MKGWISVLPLSNSHAQAVRQDVVVVANVGIAWFRQFRVFGHQSGPGQRSGGPSGAKFQVFGAPVFLEGSQEAHIHHIIEFLGETGDVVGPGGRRAGNEEGAGDRADGLRDWDGEWGLGVPSG
jgi:hypothetical protein